jgi:hypothetical protein
MSELGLALRRIKAVIVAAALTPAYLCVILARGWDGWVDFVAVRRIGAKPSTIFDLLDPTARGNRYALRGETLEPLPGEPPRWHLAKPGGSSDAFVLTLAERAENKTIAYLVVPADGGPVGEIRHTFDRYDIVADGQDSIVSLKQAARFAEDISPLSFAFHAMLVRQSLGIDLHRLATETKLTKPN